MFPRFSTSCLRATTVKHAWHNRQPLIKNLHTLPSKKPTLITTSFWTPNNQISKRIFATTKPTFIPKPTNTTAPIVKAVDKKTVPTVGGSAVDVNKRNATDWAIIKQLMKYIWPKNDVGVKTRVVIALSLLIGGKVSNEGKIEIIREYLINLDVCVHSC